MLSLVHLIYMAGDKCMRQNACCIYAINGQTNGRNYTNFESNLAMMVMHLPVKFEFAWTKRF